MSLMAQMTVIDVLSELFSDYIPGTINQSEFPCKHPTRHLLKSHVIMITEISHVITWISHVITCESGTYRIEFF